MGDKEDFIIGQEVRVKFVFGQKPRTIYAKCKIIKFVDHRRNPHLKKFYAYVSGEFVGEYETPVCHGQIISEQQYFEMTHIW